MKSQETILQDLQSSMRIKPSANLLNRIQVHALADDSATYRARHRLTMKSVLIAATMVIVVFTTTAFTFGEQIIGMFSRVLWSSYDAEGNLIVRQALDEKGNIIYLDYEADPVEGDVKIPGLEGISFFSLDVPCINNMSGKHIVNNGGIAIYTNKGSEWHLDGGQTVSLSFDVTEKDWWGVYVGYIQNEKYVLYGYDPDYLYSGNTPRQIGDYNFSETDQRYILSGNTKIEMIIPEDGEYAFFIVNVSAGDVLLNSCLISY